MDTRHLIEELVFEFNFDSLPDARAFEDGLSGWLRDSVLPPFESLLDALSGTGEPLRFDALEIDLGDIEAANFRHELQARLLTRLRAALEEKIGQLRHDVYGVGAIVRKEETQAELQQILSFLSSGNLIWQVSGDPSTAHERLLKRVIKTDGRLLFREIGRSARRQTMLARLVRQFPHKTLLLFLRAGLGIDGVLLQELSDGLQIPVATGLANGTVSGPAVLFGECLLECAWDDGSIDEEGLATRAIAAYLDKGGAANRRQIAMFAATVANGPGATSTLNRVLRMALQQSGEPAGETPLAVGVAAGATALPDTGETSAPSREYIDQSTTWLAETSRLLRLGVLKADNLKLDARQMSRLLAYFIAHDEQAGIGNRLAFVEAIESHLASRLELPTSGHGGAPAGPLPDARLFYALVIKRLLDRQLVDLEAITMESSRIGAVPHSRAGAGKSSPISARSVDLDTPFSEQRGASAQAMGTASPPVASSTTAAPVPLEQLRQRLADYLLHGDAEQLSTVWHLLYRRHASMTRDALRHYGRFERVRRQFVDSFPAAMLREFVELIEPEAKPVFSWIGDHAPTLAIDEIDVDVLRRDSWRVIFDFLLADGAVPFDLPKLVGVVVNHAAKRVEDAGQRNSRDALRRVIEGWSDALDIDAPDAVRQVLRDLGATVGISIVAHERAADQTGDEILAAIRRRLVRTAQDQGADRYAGEPVEPSKSGRDASADEQSVGSLRESRILSLAIDVLLAQQPSLIGELFGMRLRGEFSWRSLDLRREQLLRLLQLRAHLNIAPTPGHHAAALGHTNLSLAEIERYLTELDDPADFLYAMLDQQDANELTASHDLTAMRPGEGHSPPQSTEFTRDAVSLSSVLFVAPKSVSGGDEPGRSGEAVALADTWQRILRGESILASRPWSIAELKGLILTAVTWHAGRKSDAPMHMLHMIDGYAARAPEREYFYAVVLDNLAKGAALDLDAILRSRQQTARQSGASLTDEATSPPDGSRIAVDSGDNVRSRPDPAQSTSGTLVQEAVTIWQRLRRAEIHALDLGWGQDKLRDLLVVALESAALAPATQGVASDAMLAQDQPDLGVHLIGGKGGAGGIDPVHESSSWPGAASSKAFLGAIDEHARRAQNLAAYYRIILENLAAGEPVDLERALESSKHADAGKIQIQPEHTMTAPQPVARVAQSEAQSEAQSGAQSGAQSEAQSGAQSGAQYALDDAAQDASCVELEGALHSTSRQQGERLRVAFLSLQAKLAGPLDAISGSELMFLIDRYLEVVAGSDAGNRKMFLGAVTDHAASSANRSRYLRLALARLLRRETVDLEELRRQTEQTAQQIETRGPRFDSNEAIAQVRLGNVVETVEGRPIPSGGLTESWQPHTDTDAQYLARHRIAATHLPASDETTGSQGLVSVSAHDRALRAGTENMLDPRVWRERIQTEIIRQSTGAVERQAAFLHAIENHAHLASDLSQYYRLVLEALQQNRIVDLESIVAESDQIAVRTDSLLQSLSGNVEEGQAVDARSNNVMRKQAESREMNTQSIDEAAGPANGGATEFSASEPVTAMVWAAQLQRAATEGNQPQGRALIRRITVGRDAEAAEHLLTCLAGTNFNQKLVGLLPAGDLTSLLVALVGATGRVVAQYANAAAEAIHFLSDKFTQPQAFTLAWRATFDYFFVERGTFGNKAFPTMLTGRLARELGLQSTRALRELIDACMRAVSPANQSSPQTPEVDTHDADSVDVRSAAHRAPLLGRGMVSGNRTTSTALAQSSRGEGAASSEAYDAATQSNIDVHVDNAGLVLAWPYLPRLFGILNLMENNVFVSREAAERAVHLLQFMVTGQSRTPEYALVLNKQLCGIATGLPIVAGIEITGQEKETIEHLIHGMIQNWKAIGNTSIEGFRQSFLQRQGWLSLQEEVWHLRVQTRAFDILLDQLPWGISMVKHAWMTRPIHVKWR